MKAGRLRAAAVALAAGFAGFAVAAADAPPSFRVQVALRTTPGASVQRIAVPGRVLAAAQREDLGDVRVFDAKGQAMQIAIADPAATKGVGRKIPLRAYPILGSPGTLKVTGLSLKVDDDRTARIIGLDGVVDEVRKTAVLGVLLDTRAIRIPAAGLLLEASLPISQPVKFQVEASPDLADWHPVAQKILYRAAPTDRPLASETIALDDADLAGRYLRVSWSAASPLLSPVEVRSATLLTAEHGDAGRIVVEGVLPPLVDPHRIDFELPFGARLVALRIVPAAGTMVVPIRLFGRDDREQPWTLLGSGSVYRLNSDGSERSNGAIELGERTFRQIRIEADARSPGFSTAPGIELQFTPRMIVALLSGTPPFVLAAGSATAQPAYLALRDLVPVGRVDHLPAAVAQDGPAAALILPPPDSGTPQRTMLLWGALLLGTLALGGIVWALYRSMNRGPSATDAPLA